MDSDTEKLLDALSTRDMVIEVTLVNLIAELAVAGVITAGSLTSKLRTIARADVNADSRSALESLAGRIEKRVAGG